MGDYSSPLVAQITFERLFNNYVSACVYFSPTLGEQYAFLSASTSTSKAKMSLIFNTSRTLTVNAFLKNKQPPPKTAAQAYLPSGVRDLIFPGAGVQRPLQQDAWGCASGAAASLRPVEIREITFKKVVILSSC